MSGSGAVTWCAHLLVARHLEVYDMEKKTCLSEFLCPVGGSMDMTVLGVHGKLYVEVIRT